MHDGFSLQVSDTDSPLHQPLSARRQESPAASGCSPAGSRAGEPTTCAICLDTLKSYGARRSLQCGHVFHVKCVTKWLKARTKKGQGASCPLCRKSEPARAAVCIR